GPHAARAEGARRLGGGHRRPGQRQPACGRRAPADGLGNGRGRRGHAPPDPRNLRPAGQHPHAGLGREPERQRGQRRLPVRVRAPAAGVNFPRSCAVAAPRRSSPISPVPIMHQNGFTTTILRSDRRQSVEHGAVHKPIHTSSEFAYGDARELAAVFQGKAGFTYSRQGTPTTAALEAKISQMEGGAGTVSFATGMAALSAVFTTLLRKGDHLLSSQYVFGNTNSLLGTLAELGVEVSYVDPTDAAQVRAALRPNTRMVFTETIANPGTQLADLAGIGALCRERGLVYMIDNTLTS